MEQSPPSEEWRQDERPPWWLDEEDLHGPFNPAPPRCDFITQEPSRTSGPRKTADGVSLEAEGVDNERQERREARAEEEDEANDNGAEDESLDDKPGGHRSYVSPRHVPAGGAWLNQCTFDWKMTSAALLFYLCLALCASFISELSGLRNYTRITDEKTWVEAREYCRQNYNELAFTDNTAEHNQVVAYSPDGQRRPWIGLYLCSGNLWRWSNSGNTSFSGWTSSPPPGDNKKACVKMDQGKWADEDCKQQRPFICYRDGTDFKGPEVFSSSCEENIYSTTSTRATITSAYSKTTTRSTTLNTTRVTHTTTQIPTSTISHIPLMSTGVSTFPERTTTEGLGQSSEMSTLHGSTSMRSSDHSPWTSEKTSPAPGSSSQSISSPFQHQTASPDTGNCSSCNLHLVTEWMSWSEARNHCISTYTDLASIPVADIQWAISKLLVYLDPAPGAWIGLRRSRVWGYWYWVDEEPLDFSYWGKGEPSNPPSERCGMVSRAPGKNFTWEDECCGVRLPFICYSKMNNTV
ncbi:uncharacterized protein LOC144797850 [Lissotriton helveticus]